MHGVAKVQLQNALLLLSLSGRCLLRAACCGYRTALGDWRLHSTNRGLSLIRDKHVATRSHDLN